MEFCFTLEFTSSMKKGCVLRQAMSYHGLDLFRPCSLSKSCRSSDQENMHLNTWLSYMLKVQHVLKLAHHLLIFLLVNREQM